MKAIVTRADDCGSSHAANEAIYEAAEAGFIKNVSIMACGEYLEEAAEMLSDKKEICFGLHGCINSEWDKVIWGPVAPKDRVASLIDERGVFYQSPERFCLHMPDLEEIITEYKYQLDYVRKAGFEISYMDSHMLPEVYVPGLSEAMSRMIEEEGLIDHKWYNRILPGNDLLAEKPHLFEKVLEEMDGQYLFVMHPAKYGREMKMTGNAEFSGEQVARGRELDYRFLTDYQNVMLCKKHKVELLRYDEAVKGQEISLFHMADFKKEIK